MDDLEKLLLMHQMQQQQQGGFPMQRPPMGPAGGGMYQPPDSAITGVGPMPEMQAPFGSQVKDYLAAGSGALGGAGLAAGLGRGIAMPATQGLGGEALKAFAKNKGMTLEQLLRMLAGRGAQTGQAGGYLGNSGLAGANQIAIGQGMNNRPMMP